MAINQLSPQNNKTLLAKKMNLSRSSLYYRPKLPAKDLKLKTAIEMVLIKHKAYGHKRIAIELKVNKKRVIRVMRLFKLKPKRQRKQPKKPSDLGQTPMTVPNLVLGKVIDAGSQIWASDFTYLPYFGRFVYLATVEDLFTRQIVGWELSTRHNANLVSQALINGLKHFPAPKINHSDQGSEYRSRQYANLLKSSGIVQSMSKKASPWQNGYQESFYSEFKLELGQPENYTTLGELVEAISHQISYYNNDRIHTALKCPPAVFAQKNIGSNDYLENILNYMTPVRQVV